MKPSDILLPKAVEWKDSTLIILDQTKLPLEEVFISCNRVSQVWDCIKNLNVRGAPAIGIAGAYGFYLGLREEKFISSEELKIKSIKIFDYLNTCRPTAVNLNWCLKRMKEIVDRHANESLEFLLNHLLDEAIAIHEEDRNVCLRISQCGLPLIKQGMNILTHCNTGMIAVSEWGTALGIMHLAHKNGTKFHVYVDETRPLLQGSRLTAWELIQAGIDCTLVTDSMAAFLMSQKKVDLILVGTDRVTANGDVANKIGTLGLAVIAKCYKIPFYVACPLSSIDWKTKMGSEIEIEERSSKEITHIKDQQIAPDGVNVYNPSFDITPHSLVTGVITELGLFEGPNYMEKLSHVTKVN